MNNGSSYINHRQFKNKNTHQKIGAHPLRVRGEPYAHGMGEKYRKQGHALSPRVYDVLIREGYCTDPQDCNRKEVLFGEHGNRVNWHLYGVHDRKLIASVLSMVAAEGMEITGGVPITIRFFSKHKKEFTLWDEVTAKPSIIMEVNE